jgi:hypothetical protein
MTAPPTAAAPDERLLEEALVVVRAARDRAPADFLVALAVVLGALSAGLFAIGLLVGDPLGDVALDLAVEVFGAWLTVVLIDGLWKRQETGASERLREMEHRLAARLDGSAELTDAERAGWRAFVDEYRDLTTRTTVVERLSATRGYGRRVHRLERHGERLLGFE